MKREKPMSRSRIVFLLFAVAGVLSWSEAVFAQTATNSAVDAPPANLQAPGEQTAVEGATEAAPEPPGRPFSLGVTYYLFSDYVFRGINFSEYFGEGREKPNHQMTTALDIPLGKDGQYGTFGFDTFFEWYAAQKKLNPETGGQNLQEVDYTLRWSYELEPVATTFTMGWTDYTFPNAHPIRTNEIFFKFAHNDAWMWRGLGYQGEEGVLNPSLFIAQDLRYSRGYWVELGLNHPFDVCKNLTVTPKLTFALDGGYLQPLLTGGEGQKSLEYAYTQYGLDVTYTLNDLLHIPEAAGSVFISGQLYFNEASRVEKRQGIIQDELYGGMALGWSW
jgi:hypothetical protein